MSASTPFSFTPSPLSVVISLSSAILIGYIVHVVIKLTKTVEISEFFKWNELKRYHVLVSILNILLLTTDIIVKLGCTAFRDRDLLLPVECDILILGLIGPFNLAATVLVLESVIFSYVRLYMILPGKYFPFLNFMKEKTKDSLFGSGTSTSFTLWQPFFS
jgi:hypothetical protein